MEHNESDDLDLGAAIQSARDNDEGEDPHLDVVSKTGLSGDLESYGDKGDLPYVVLLKAAVSMIKSGEISMEEYIEGVGKLDAIADNALKLYAIPAVKKDLPGKLTEHQNAIVGGLEGEIHRMKEGLGLLLSYPESRAIGDLEVGLETAVSAMNEIGKIQNAADDEHARLKQQEQEDKARRAEKAAQAES